jgi:hypothetical protein
MEYTYIVQAGQFSHEFSYPDKNCKHKVGDVFPDDFENELTVMEIDHNNGYVFCSGAVYE